MTAVSRSAQFAKVYRVVKKAYKAPARTTRSVIEHLLFACCLEDAHHDEAEEAFASLVHTFFDWNEVRVTSISELSEVMACLADPRAAANRIKRVLHSVFEATFNFDLEDRRKKNLGPTVKWLEKLDGATPFTVAYIVQHALGGHSIPIDAGTMAVLRVLDLVTDKDINAGSVPGLERAVSKSKGIEFGALLHELGADYSANPYSPGIRETLRQINPECESRLPKRRTVRVPPKVEKPEKQKTAHGAAPAAHADKKKPAAARKVASKKKADGGSVPPTADGEKKRSGGRQRAAGTTASQRRPSREPASNKRSATARLSKRKPR